ncbi:ankyrin repeat domain-containing protein [Curtobacterium sp. MCBA15_008]|uniref:ankyrin repeat domain-containing protein n=1 Tax=Curtobacterium sp. MCBA15_008 TaxID=1898736 RepID=UPI0008DCA859|nr:ankyrin repeat domain-containing protein [Curtobacterium sp. MCBA15_008]OII09009.1 hypothetical protein BIU96_03630 [Curtobacterium sp. MCBA15_008]
MQWSHLNWPSPGYASIEDVPGYQEHLARLVSDAPPSVAALASVAWDGARFESWTTTEDEVSFAMIIRNDEVLDTEHGLWRRWNHARVSLRLAGASAEPSTSGALDLLGGDVHVVRGEIGHVGDARWELRLLVSPTGELAMSFGALSLAVDPVDETVWSALEGRPEHGWRGPFADGWVDWATPAVRAAALGDIGGLSLALEAFGPDREDPDALDPRWGFAPLHAAAWFDQTSTAEMLVDRGASVDALDAHGRTAYEIALVRSALGVSGLLEASTGASRTDLST